MAFNKTDRPEGAKMRRPGGMRRRKKVCVFCGDKNDMGIPSSRSHDYRSDSRHVRSSVPYAWLFS